MVLLTDLKEIERIAEAKQAENDDFIVYIRQQNAAAIDAIVHQLNRDASREIDCKKCGNCCKTLLEVTPQEISTVAAALQISPSIFREKYILETDYGRTMINKVPCHFLNGTTCAVYENRFSQCRDFPYLHKPNFSARVFSTILFYGKCPIIFNTIEALKQSLEFRAADG